MRNCIPSASTPTRSRPDGLHQRLRISAPYNFILPWVSVELGLFAVLGFWWVIRPDHAPIAKNLPLIRPSGQTRESHSVRVLRLDSIRIRRARDLAEEGAVGGRVSKLVSFIFQP